MTPSTMLRGGWLVLISLVVGVLGDGGVITDLRVTSRIEQRYAQTTVTSYMKNPTTEAMELKFKMSLPKTAFISALVMEIEGQNYTSTVKGKEAARRTYDQAKQKGKTTGLIEQREDTIQKFEVSANVEAEGKVTFYLRYEELLRRVKGKYLYDVKVRPGHVVPSVTVDVHIIENEAVKDLKILELPGKENVTDDYSPYVSEYRPRPGEVRLSYAYEDSSVTSGGEGLDGSFSLSYDIDMKPDGGEVQVVGNYFVHHFIPEGLPKMPVHTVFVLDISSSMSDGKLEQMKEAMEAILKDLRVEDTFELITFESSIKNLGKFKARGNELKRALKIIRRLKVQGATNLYDAYMESVNSIKTFNETNAAKQVVFLTDGVATAGQTNKAIIRRDVREANTLQFPIFGLAFGNDADFDLLKKVSADNRAFARKIAVNEDTHSQLTGFYEEVSTPLMAEVAIDYYDYDVETNSVVKQGPSNFYSGGEVISAGHLAEGVTEIRPVVKGVGKDGPLQFQVQRVESRPSDTSAERDNFVARLWAYLKVQDLLEQTSVAEDKSQVENLKKEALEIALRFNFVTKLTSLVVVRPEESLEEPILGKKEKGGDGQEAPGQTHTLRDYTSRDSKAQRASYHNVAYPTVHRIASRLSHFGRSRNRNYVDNDPHFVVSAPGMALPFCFDLHAQDGAVLNLITDPPSRIMVNGQVTSAVGRPDLTYFTTLYLAFDQFAMSITTDSIRIHCQQNGKENISGSSHGSRRRSRQTKRGNWLSGRSRAIMCSRSSTWRKAVGKRYDDVILELPKRRKLHIIKGDGEAHFVVVRSKNKYGQPFLGFYLQSERIFSANTTGLIGEFTTKNVTSAIADDIVEEVDANSGKRTPMNVLVQRLNHLKEYETSQVSGFLGHRRSLLDKTHVRCLHVKNSGRGLLDGTPDDYIVPCLTCRGLQFQMPFNHR